MEFYCDIDQDRKVLGKKGYCPWKVMEFYCDIDQDRKVLGKKGYCPWKVLEICLTQVKNRMCVADSK